MTVIGNLLPGILRGALARGAELLELGRLVPNLREIGLVTPRMRARYEKHGMAEYIGGIAANHPDAERFVTQLS